MVLYPERSYQDFTEGYCPFQFEHPNYLQVEQDTTFFEEKPIDECWFDLVASNFDARIHFTYYPMKNADRLEKLKNDAFNLVNKHVQRANYIDEFPIQKPDGTIGFLFKMDGPSANPLSFYLTDSSQHYVRGALYFRTQVRPDSLAPVIDFVEQDIMKVIETFEWKK